ncbi:DUF1338 domain-containing protein [Reichenbachiella ulvae]|uniref:2-oxoadipate dioxygenase/decarboxylase n=1 Tax=Reichenbachiella ulvae TaxID=2980104 RepID=A0ABT3CVL0_9BACT|nr:DUF1338 domain-containing protein [Reichenbachiella ulvae]MCV9387730.1 DUF1338 domain-containing protein [Reichenbachiella ulvae]
MSYKEVIAKCWSDYVDKTPSAAKIHEILEGRGEHIVNDHIAFRTFGHPKVNTDKLAAVFVDLGYKESGEYYFEAKKLRAKHYEHPDTDAPRIFISELILEEFSEGLQKTIDGLCMSVEKGKINFPSRPWGFPSYKTYQKLLEESEYAAWTYVFGFCANHFTIFINHLKNIHSLEEMNELLIKEGFPMNVSGGMIKGSPDQLLEQSSILADKQAVRFQEGTYEIPSCYYEFARRYPSKDGELFTGFIAKSADKIFESTHSR